MTIRFIEIEIFDSSNFFQATKVTSVVISRTCDLSKATEREVVCPRVSGSRGPHQLKSKFLFIASSDVLKEPPNRSSLQGSKSASRFSFPRFPCFLPLLLTSITDARGLILQFCPWASKTSLGTWIFPAHSKSFNKFQNMNHYAPLDYD